MQATGGAVVVRVVYVAKHYQRCSNQDEEAVAFALQVLGHDVVCVEERFGDRALRETGDFALIHHWHDTSTIYRISQRMPVVFWCFDLIDWPNDPWLSKRNLERREWVQALTELCTVGFLTDGDWVAQDTTGKLFWLPQGADERVAGRGDPSAWGDVPPILFTGISNGGGQGRVSWVKEMKETYGEQFHHVERKVHGERLRDLIAASQIVVAPDSPVTNRYASNRVWISCGFGGFLIHPYCAFLEQHYRNGDEVLLYHNRQDLHEMIRVSLDAPKTRRLIAEAGLKRTLAEHLYRHRVQRLVQIVQGRLR